MRLKPTILAGQWREGHEHWWLGEDALLVLKPAE